jgi:hypothetical protein
MWLLYVMKFGISRKEWLQDWFVAAAVQSCTTRTLLQVRTQLGNHGVLHGLHGHQGRLFLDVCLTSSASAALLLHDM